MSTFDRRKYIITLLQEKKEISISELTSLLNVSSMTIRRDLAFFSSQGLVTLIQGGVKINTGALYEHTMPLKQTEMIIEKTKICEYAKTLIKEGDAIFLDSGSTNQILANLISEKKNIVVITHSLLVANSLIYSKNIKLIMLPGVFREKSMAFLGNSTTNFLKQFKIDIAFLSCEGLDLKYGATLPDILDSELKASVMKQAQKKILLADSSKIGKSFLSSFTKLENLDLIVIDDKISSKDIKDLKKSDINLHICN